MVLPLYGARRINCSFSCFAEENSQTENYSIGIGMGAMYSGIGANVAVVSKNDFKYMSAGCNAYSSANGSECDFSIGWVTTDLFDFATNNHSFGISFHATNAEFEGKGGGFFQLGYQF
jgi:hypothetical protein